MGRYHQDLSENVTSVTGNDHAVGKFVQLYDQRYAATPDDLQGEGIVLDWCALFGFTTNLIGASVDDLEDISKLLKLCDEFAQDLE